MNIKDEIRLETAACLWEAFLNFRQNTETTLNGTLHTWVDNWLEDSGWSEVRLTVIGWTDDCIAAWDAASAEGNYRYCYDWDFVPEWLADRLEEHLAGARV